MKNVYCPLLFVLLLPLTFSTCSSKEKEAQVMTMDGAIREVFNYKELELNKGDTIVIVNYCNHKIHPSCKSSISGIYTGKLLDTDVTWEGGQIKASYTYEKAVFLRNISE